MRQIKVKEVSENFEALVSTPRSSAHRRSVMSEGNVGEFYYINIDRLVPYENQARKRFDENSLKDLSETIKEYGIRQPLTVAKSEETGFYKVISGERRLRAAKIAKLEKIPCIILSNSEKKEEIALLENLHRIDLHPIEMGEAYQLCLDNDETLTQEKLGQKLGVTQSIISERIKYAHLPISIKDKLLEDNIKTRHILRKILKSKNEDEMKSILGLSPTSRKIKRSLFNIYTQDGKISLHCYKNNLTDKQKQETIKRLKELILSLENS